VEGALLLVAAVVVVGHGSITEGALQREICLIVASYIASYIAVFVSKIIV
jgi:hypothetical protein